MKTKTERIPIGLIELIDAQAKRKDTPRVYVWKELEETMKGSSNIGDMLREKKRDGKSPFKF
jgi:hypothetical protein